MGDFATTILPPFGGLKSWLEIVFNLKFDFSNSNLEFDKIKLSNCFLFVLVCLLGVCVWLGEWGGNHFICDVVCVCITRTEHTLITHRLIF